jgi:fumarylacetoacetate (FAA) hydrolase family protein
VIVPTEFSQPSTEAPSVGLYLARVWSRLHNMPRLWVGQHGSWRDATTTLPTVAHVLRSPDAAAACDAAWQGGRSIDAHEASQCNWLAPCDLQPVKAAGVTFAASLLERVIEEHAKGDASLARTLREEVTAALGGDLSQIKPGSYAAAELAKRLKANGLWSQYLEVGIGPDAEIFTKCPPMAAVGHGADVGIHRSSWNNPEPEVVLSIDCSGTIVGAALGNDVNLRDVEGRSALLLGKAKDNNASTAIGPYLRLLDSSFGLDDLRQLRIDLEVQGASNPMHPGGFQANCINTMASISRDITELARQLFDGHNYPDGAMLFCGTMVVPTADRHAVGQGFTHAVGDVVTIRAAGLGELRNRVVQSTDAPPWRYGLLDLMRDLSRRSESGLNPG